MPPLTVLVADEDPMARAALQEIYASVGMSSLAVASGEAFFAELSARVPDLCRLDMFLPDLFGTAAIEQINSRPELARAAVIAMSSRQDPNVLVQALNAGADDFLFKPIAGEELIARSRIAIQRRRSTSPLGGTRGSRRRDVTTLFCDVRGFTAVAATLDPEWVVELLNALFERLVAHVDARGGEVDKYLGDGLLAFFGARNGAEDKELHALEAALAMVSTAEDYSRESLVLGGRRLAVGAGIATGEVVIAPVGAFERKQVTAIGDSVNLASRLQAVAAEGEVLICERTFQRAQGAVLSPGPRRVELKGIAGEPLVYPVTGVRPEAWLR